MGTLADWAAPSCSKPSCGQRIATVVRVTKGGYYCCQSHRSNNTIEYRDGH